MEAPDQKKTGAMTKSALAPSRRRKSSGLRKSCGASMTRSCAPWPTLTIIGGVQNGIAPARRKAASAISLSHYLEFWTISTVLSTHRRCAISVAQGIQAIYRNLLAVLDRHGVTRFNSVGEAFDPRFHDAIGTVDSDEMKPGTVAEEIQSGYRWGDELLRPARVRVAQ